MHDILRASAELIFIKHPRIYDYWNMLIVGMFLAAAVYIPLNIALHQTEFVLPQLKWLLVLFFVIDFFIEFLRVKIFRPSIHGLTSADLIMDRNLSFDLAAALPFFIISPLPAMGVTHLLKVRKIWRLVRLMWLHRWKRTQLWLLLVIVMAMLVVFHWIACGWLMIRPHMMMDNVANSYIDAFYWTVTTITTVGYGDIVPTTPLEKIYAGVAMLTGFGFFGLIIGNIISVFSSSDPDREHFARNIENLTIFTRHRALPPELRNQIFQFFTYKWKSRKGVDESDFLQSLPAGLRKQVILYLRQDVVEKTPLFGGLPESFITDMATQLEPHIYTPGEYIFRAGDDARGLFFLISGRVSVLDGKTDAVVTELNSGDYFGEISLLQHTQRTKSIRAETYCDIYLLSAEDFNRVLLNHEEVAARITEVAQERLGRDG